MKLYIVNFILYSFSCVCDVCAVGSLTCSIGMIGPGLRSLMSKRVEEDEQGMCSKRGVLSSAKCSDLC